ncbi:MAG: molybdopterin cofactor-binding domain-containing protein [Gammaproteobacteria bacterium]
MPSRRTFILAGTALGGGLLLGVVLPSRLDDGDAAAKFARLGQAGAPLNAWLKISADGTVTCAIHRAEMGQGVTTSLAMLLAEELDADWRQVRFEFAPVDRDYYNFGMLLDGQPLGDPAASWGAATGTWAMRQLFHGIGLSMTISSTSVVDAWDTLRPAGATARQMLIDAAARQWQVPADSLTTRDGFVIDPANDRQRGYGELAEAAAEEKPRDDVAIKDPSQFRLVGTDVTRLATPLQVTGTAQFGVDVVRPDMLYATVVHSPVAGTAVAAFDTQGAENMPGVEHIGLVGKPGAEWAVAVIAQNTWQAQQAAKRLTVTPQKVTGELMNTATVSDDYQALLDQPELIVFRDDGAAAATLESAEQVVSATYEVPFLAHACMEPMNCTAHYTGDALEVWAPSQAHSMARDIAAELAGLDKAAVTLHTPFMGGGFGRRAEMDFVEQAVTAALQVPGRPVKLTWSREQDIRHDAYRPAAVCRVSGTTDASGQLVALDYRVATQSVVASYEPPTPPPRGWDAETDKSVVTAIDPPVYDLPHLKVSYAPVHSHMPAGFWRSVSHSWNTFFIESFVDELALAAQMTPLAFRRQALADKPRHLAALNAVASDGGKLSVDGIGYAVAESHESVVAHAVEVMTKDGRFARVKRVICAIDCGPVIHPDGVRAQMEGSIVDGLSAALYGQLDISDGVVEQGNFDTYRRLRLADTPEIVVIILRSQQTRPAGTGEPAVPGVAPALANAIFAATGQRHRQLPLQA